MQVFAIFADFKNLPTEYLHLGVGLRLTCLVYFVGIGLLTAISPATIRRLHFFMAAALLPFVSVTIGTLSGLVSGGVDALYWAFLIQSEFATATFITMPRKALIGGVVLSNLYVPAALVFIQGLPEGNAFPNFCLTLAFCALIAVVAQHMILTYNESSFLQRQELAAAKRKAENILTSITNSFFHLDRDWRFTYFNPEAEGLLSRMRHSKESLLGVNIWRAFPNLAADSLMHNEFHRAVRENVPVRFEEYYPLMDVHLEVHAYPSSDGISVYCSDITARKLAEETLALSHEQLERGVAERTSQLRELLGKLDSIREDERLRISREIHDDLGQILTVLRMDVSWLKDRLATADENAGHRLVAMSQLVDQTIKRVRQVASDLRPAVLDDFGLAAALGWLAERVDGETVAVRVAVDAADLALPPECSIAVFRIVQEALNNAVKHSAGSTIDIRLLERRGLLIIEVEDNGKGIGDEVMSGRRRGIGLISMRERAAQLGGELTVTGEPGHGTLVRLELPLQNKSKATSL